MKKTSKYILLLFFCIFLCTFLFLKENSFFQKNFLHTTTSKHPYGNPIKSPFIWESNSDFLDLCEKNNLFIRMSAFKIILPNPETSEKYNVVHAANLLKGTVVEPNTIFSMNKTLGPYTLKRGFKKGPSFSGTYTINTPGGGVCKIASALFNAAVLANLPIIEKHAHGMQVPYVPPGQDATVAYGAKDLKFKNNTEHPILIWSHTEGNSLYIAFYGRTIPPKVTWNHKILHRQKIPTYYRYNSDLKAGEEKILKEGAEGLTVKSWLTIKYANDKIETKNLGVVYYKPKPRIIEKGIR